jgi:hypothetical protein
MTNVGPPRSWRGYFFSTSNLTLDAMAQRGKVMLDDAQRSRVSEIPLPSSGRGIYENLHGFPSGGDLTDILVVHCRRYYGVAGREFQRKLVASRKRNVKQLRRSLRCWRNRYIRALKTKAKAEGVKPLQRSTGRCATTYAAGRLAIQYGILPWERKQLLPAILACQLDGLRWAKAKHLATDMSVAGLRRQLLTYMRDQRPEFMNLDQRQPRLGKHQFGSAPGYSATFKGEKWVYLTADQLTGIIGSGDHAVQLKKQLVQDGMLATRANGRCLVQRPVFSGAKGNKGHRWVHAFRARLLKQQRQE